MANEIELGAGFADPALRLRIEVGIVIVASEIVSGADGVAPYSQAAGAHDLRVQWANSVLTNTSGEALIMQKLLLGVFNAANITAILATTLDTVTNEVRKVVDELAGVRFPVTVPTGV